MGKSMHCHGGCLEIPYTVSAQHVAWDSHAFCFEISQFSLNMLCRAPMGSLVAPDKLSRVIMGKVGTKKRNVVLFARIFPTFPVSCFINPGFEITSRVTRPLQNIPPSLFRHARLFSDFA